MKKIILMFIVITMLITPVNVFAAPPEFMGGVNNEYEYEEIVFITGEPIKFVGTMDVSIRERNDSKTISYRLRNLTPEDKSIEGSLTRTINYEIEYEDRSDKGQTIGQMSVTGRPTEKIVINGDTFSLKDYQFSKSDVIDNRPASDFYTGNVTARKVYDINPSGRTSEGEAIVNITGASVGYENFWGATETQIIDYTYDINWETPEEGGDEDDTEDRSWQGTVTSQVSDSMTNELRYSDNEANFSSFNGGYVRITNSDIVGEYKYDLPLMRKDGPDSRRRDRGVKYLSKDMAPNIERLIVPKFRDLGGHWAEDHINKLYSLDVFDEVSDFFVPDVPMSREEFTRAVIRASDIRPNQEEDDRRTRRRRDEEPEKSPFIDVSTEAKNYEYIKNGVEKGIIQGISDIEFRPSESLTRAQAITVIIRALGFESKAPTPGYSTSFADDREIPSWAKDSIYMAQEIGLVKGDNLNRVNPNDVLTRAESSAMLVRFLEFLEEDLQRDYRENIILYN